ncbi:MAG: RNA polymerase subunit sigma-54 [Alphaproteobacteria bacterium]|nr:RNA polymerase subunit sigma-54 [Alphaproteobacteria bacterium]PPR13370.1 MAG: Riboflavin transporter [Alphaproteobacteria bacterium MarineAlpha12_Bin1]
MDFSRLYLIDRLPKNIQGMVWMFFTTILVVTMHTFIRDLSQELPPVEIAFFRNFFGFPVVLFLLRKYGWALIRTQRMGTHVVRSLGHVVAMLMFFTGIATTPLATTNALAFAAPLFAAALAMIFLGEVFQWQRWAALLFGFAGTLVILRPGFIPMEFGPLLILFASFIWGSILVVIKSLGRSDAPGTIILYMVAFMTPLSLIPALFVWVWPTAEQIGLMFIMGIMGTVGQLTTAHALKVADTAVVMPIDFFRLVWASILGYFLFAEMLDVFTWIGGTMIFTGALYLALRERKEQSRAE